MFLVVKQKETDLKWASLARSKNLSQQLNQGFCTCDILKSFISKREKTISILKSKFDLKILRKTKKLLSVEFEFTEE